MTQVNQGIALASASGIAASLLGGYVCDRFGRRRSLILSMIGSAILFALYPTIRSVWAYLVASIFSGAFLSLYWPASTAMITDLTPLELRTHAFTLARVVVNGALGIGVLMAGLIVELFGGLFDDPSRVYHLLYYIDALTYILFLFILWCFVRETLPQSSATQYGGFVKGWGEALQDSRLRIYAVLMTSINTAYAVFSILPVILKEYAGMHAFSTSLVIALNTGLIVVFQMPFGSHLAGTKRTRALCRAGALFALGLILFAAACSGPLRGMLMATVAMIVFTAGEMIHGPSADALVSSMAPQHLRGTYMSVNSATWALGLAIGPCISGPLLDAGAPRLVMVVFAVIVLAAGIGFLFLDPGQNS
jgi:MFS family permease